MSNPYDTLFEKYIPVHLDMSQNKTKTDISNLTYFNTTHNIDTYFNNSDDQELQPLKTYKNGNDYQKQIVQDFSSNYVKWVIDNSIFIQSVSAEQINGNWQYTLSMDYLRKNWKSNNQSASFKYNITDTNHQINPIQTNTMVINPAILNRDTSYNHIVTSINNSVGSTINNHVVRNTYLNINKPSGNQAGGKGIEDHYPKGEYQRTSLNKFTLHQFSNSGEDLSATVVINTVKPMWNIQNQILVTTQYDFSYSPNSLYNRYADNRIGADVSFTYNLQDISLVPAIKAIYPQYNKDLSFTVYGKEMTYNTVQADFSNVYTTNVKKRLSEKGMMIDFSYSNPIFDVSQTIFNKLMEKAMGKPASTFSNTSQSNFETSLNIVIADGSLNGFIGALNTDSSGVVMNFPPKIQNVKDEPIAVLNRNSASFKNRFAKTQPLIPIIEIEKPTPQTIYVGSKEPNVASSSVFIALLNNQLESTNPHIIHANYEANPSDISLTITVSGDGITSGTMLRHDPTNITDSSFTTIAVTAVNPSKPLNQNENLPMKFVYQAIIKNSNQIKASDISSVVIEKVRSYGSGVTLSNELLPPQNRIPGYIPRLSLTNINSNYIFLKTAQFLLGAYSVAPILTSAGTIYINTSFSQRTIFQFDNSYALILKKDTTQSNPNKALIHLARDTTVYDTHRGSNYINENTSYQIAFQNNSATNEFKVYVNGNLDFTVPNTQNLRITAGVITGPTVKDIKYVYGIGIFDNNINHTNQKLDNFRDLNLYYNNPDTNLTNNTTTDYNSRFFTDNDFQNSSFETKSDYVAPVNGIALPYQSKLTKTYEHPAGNTSAIIKPKLSIQQATHPGQTWPEHHESLHAQSVSNAVQNALQGLITANPTNAAATITAIANSTPNASVAINQANTNNLGNSPSNNATIGVSIAGASAGGAQSIAAAGNTAATTINNSSSSIAGTSSTTALNAISTAVTANPSSSGTQNTGLSSAVSTAVQNHITSSNDPTTAATNAIAAAAAAAGEQAARAIANLGGSQDAQNAARTSAMGAVQGAAAAGGGNTPAGAAAGMGAVQGAVQNAITNTIGDTTVVNGNPINHGITQPVQAAVPVDAGNAAIAIAAQASTIATTISNAGSTQNQTNASIAAIAAAAASAGQQAAQAIAAAGGSQAAQNAASNAASIAVQAAAAGNGGNTPAGAAAAIEAVQSAVQNAITTTAADATVNTGMSLPLGATVAQDAGTAAVSVAAGSANTSAVNNASSTAAIQAAATVASNPPANAGTVGSSSVNQAAELVGNGSSGASIAVQIAGAGGDGSNSVTQAANIAQNVANVAGATPTINAINAAASTAAQIVAAQPTGTLDISNIIAGAVNGAQPSRTPQTVAEAKTATAQTIIHSAANGAGVATIALIAKEKVTTLLPTSNSIATLKGNAKTDVLTKAYNALSSDELKTKSAKAAIIEIAKAAAESAKTKIAAAGGSTVKQNEAYSSIMNTIIQAAGSTNDLNALNNAIDAIENAVKSAITNSGVTMDTATTDTAVKESIRSGTQSGLHAIIVVGSGGIVNERLGTDMTKAIAIVNSVFTNTTTQNDIQTAGTTASTAVTTAATNAAGGGNTSNGAVAAINAVQSAIQTAIQPHSGTTVDSSTKAHAGAAGIHAAMVYASGGTSVSAPPTGGIASPASPPATNALSNTIRAVDVALGGGTSGGTGIAGAVTAAAAATSSIAATNTTNAATSVSNAVTQSGIRNFPPATPTTDVATQNAAATNAILTAAHSAGDSAAALIAANHGSIQQQEAARTAAKAHVINAGSQGGATGAAAAITSVSAAIQTGVNAAIAITPPSLTGQISTTDISTTQNTATTSAAGVAAAAATATGAAAAGGPVSGSVAALAGASAVGASTSATGGTAAQAGQAATDAAQTASNAGGTPSNTAATAAAVAGGLAATGGTGTTGGTQVQAAADAVGPSTATTTPLIEQDNTIILSALKPVINKITYDPNFNKTQVITDRRQKFTMGYNQIVSVEMNKDMTSSEITEKKVKFVNNTGADLPRIGTTTVVGKDMSNVIQTNPIYYGDISLVVYVKEGTQTYDYSSGNAELHKQTFPNTEISGNNMDMCFNRFYGENNAYQFPALTNFYDISEHANYKGGQAIANTKQPSVLYTRYRTTSGVIQDISSDFSIDISGEAFWIFSQTELNNLGSKVTNKDASINEIFKNVKLTQPNGLVVNDFSKNIHSIEFVPGTSTDVSKNRVHFKIPPPTTVGDFSFAYPRENELYKHHTVTSKISFELNPTPFTQSKQIYSKDVPENVYTRDVEIKKSNIYVFPDLPVSQTKFYNRTNEEIKNLSYASGVTTDFSYSVGQTIKAKTPLDLGSIKNYYVDSTGNEVERVANDISLNLKGFVKIERGSGETIIGPSGEGVYNAATSKKIIHANEDLTWNTDISFESGHMVYTFDLSNTSDISGILSLRSGDVSWGMPVSWSATSGNLAGAQGFVKEKIYSFPSTFDVCGVRLDKDGDISYAMSGGLKTHFGAGDTTSEHILNSHLKGFGYNIVSQIKTDNCLNLVAFNNDSLFVKKGAPSGTSPVTLDANELSSNIVEVKYTHFVDAISTLDKINSDINWTKLYSSALHSDFSGADRLTYVMRETHGNKPFRTISNELIVHKFKPTHVNDVYLAVKWKGPDGYMSDYTWAISKINREQLLSTTEERLFPNFNVHDDIRLENKLSSWVNTSPYNKIVGTQEQSDPHMDLSFNITNKIVDKKHFYKSTDLGFGINEEYIPTADLSGAALSVTSGTLLKVSNIKAGAVGTDVSGIISETSTGSAFLRFDDKNQKIHYELKPYVSDLSDTTSILTNYPNTQLFKKTQIVPYTKYVTFHHTCLLKDHKDIGITRMAGFDISYEEPNKFLRFTPLQIGTVVFPHTGNHNVLQTLYRYYQYETVMKGGVKPLYVTPGNTNDLTSGIFKTIQIYGKEPISNITNIQNNIIAKQIGNKYVLHIKYNGDELPAYIHKDDQDETTLHGHITYNGVNFKALTFDGTSIIEKGDNTVTGVKVDPTTYKEVAQFSRNCGKKLTDASFGIILDISNERHNKEWMTLSIGLNNEKTNMIQLTAATTNSDFKTYFNKHMSVYVDGVKKDLKMNKDYDITYNSMSSIMNTYPWNSEFNVLSHSDSSLSVIFGDTSSNLVTLSYEYIQTGDNKGLWYSNTKEIPSVDEEISQTRIDKELYGVDGIRKKLGFANIPDLCLYKSSVGDDKITQTHEMETLSNAYIGLQYKNNKMNIIPNVNMEVYAETPTTTDMSKVSFTIEDGRIKVDLSSVIYGYAIKNLDTTNYGLIDTERWNILADSSKSLHTMPTFKYVVSSNSLNTMNNLFLASGELIDMTFTSHNALWTPWTYDVAPYNNMDLSGYRELRNRGVSYEIIEKVGGVTTPNHTIENYNLIKLTDIKITPDTSMIYFTMKDEYGNIIKNNARFHERTSYVKNNTNSNLPYTDTLQYPYVTHKMFPFVYDPIEKVIELSNNKISSMSNEKTLHMYDKQRLTFKVDKNFASNNVDDWIEQQGNINVFINGINDIEYTKFVSDIRLSDNSFSFIFDPSALYLNAADVSFSVNVRKYVTSNPTGNINHPIYINDFSFMDVSVNGYNPEIDRVEWYDYDTNQYRAKNSDLLLTVLGSDTINYSKRLPIKARVTMKDTSDKPNGGMMDISNSFMGTNMYPGQSESSYDISAQLQQGSNVKTKVNSIKPSNFKTLEISFNVIDISYIPSTIGFKIKSNNGLLHANKKDYQAYTHGDLTLDDNNLFMIPLKNNTGVPDLEHVHRETKTYTTDVNNLQAVETNVVLKGSINNRLRVDISGMNNEFKFTNSVNQDINKYIKKIEYYSNADGSVWKQIPESQYVNNGKIQYSADSNKFNQIVFDISKQAITYDDLITTATEFKLRYTMNTPGLGLTNFTDISFETPNIPVVSLGKPQLLHTDVSFLNLENSQLNKSASTFYYTKTKGNQYNSYVTDISYDLKVVFNKDSMQTNSFIQGQGNQYFTVSGELRDGTHTVKGEFIPLQNATHTDGSHVIFRFKDVDMEKFGANEVKLHMELHNRTANTSSIIEPTSGISIASGSNLKRFYDPPTSMSSYKLSTTLGGADVKNDTRVSADVGSKYGKTKIVDINYDTNYIEATLNKVFPNNGLVDISWANVLYSTKTSYPTSSNDWKDVSNVKIIGANHDTVQYSICGSVIDTNYLWLKYDLSLANVKFESGKSNVDISFVEDLSANVYYNVGMTGQSWQHPDDGNNFY